MPPRIDFTTQRLLLDQPMAAGTELAIDKPQANYLLNVLRLEDGATLLVFNGRDGEWRARLAMTGKKSAKLVVGAQTRAQPATGTLTLAFAPLKQSRLDYLVQKAVEMGAAQIQPVITHRTQVSRLNAERLAANIREAAEQCGVLAVPELGAEMKLARYLEGLSEDRTVIFCDEFAEVSDPARALAALPRGAPVVVLIGPEGGFDADERASLLARAGTIRLALGPRILRADTAAVAALTAVQMVIGDWG